MTDDLVVWLRAALDDEEQAARDLERVGLDTVMPGAIIDRTGATVFFSEAVYERLCSVLDPARVLRDVEAKRRILAELDDWIRLVGPAGEFTDDSIDRVTRLLALPYADRPGYRPEWKP